MSEAYIYNPNSSGLSQPSWKLETSGLYVRNDDLAVVRRHSNLHSHAPKS